MEGQEEINERKNVLKKRRDRERMEGKKIEKELRKRWRTRISKRGTEKGSE